MQLPFFYAIISFISKYLKYKKKGAITKRGKSTKVDFPIFIFYFKINVSVIL